MIGEDVGVGGGGEREGGLGGAEEAEPPLGDEGRWREALEYSLYELAHRTVSIISSLSVFSDAKHRVVLVGHLSPTYYRDQSRV